jgi:glycosidase
MKFWLRAADIDGYICDDANLLPDDFWNEVRPALEQIKPVLMIADSEDNPSHFETCFQANYGWNFYEKLNALATGKENVSALAAVLAKNRSENPAGYYQVNVATLPEPDEQNDTTERTDDEIKKALAILALTAEGMPSLYGGQETGETKVVAPGEKSPVDWSNSSMEDFYTKLIQLKNFNKSLWNGKDGGTLERISDSDQIYAFIREKDGHRVVVIVNCSDQDATTTLTEDIFSLSALFGKQDLNIPKGTPIKLKGWEYWLFANPSVETN